MQAKAHFTTKLYLMNRGHLEMLSAKPWVGICQSLDLQVSISSTFYARDFRTKVLFRQNVTREKLREAL